MIRARHDTQSDVSSNIFALNIRAPSTTGISDQTYPRFTTLSVRHCVPFLMIDSRHAACEFPLTLWVTTSVISWFIWGFASTAETKLESDLPAGSVHVAMTIFSVCTLTLCVLPFELLLKRYTLVLCVSSSVLGSALMASTMSWLQLAVGGALLAPLFVCTSRMPFVQLNMTRDETTFRRNYLALEWCRNLLGPSLSRVLTLLCIATGLTWRAAPAMYAALGTGVVSWMLCTRATGNLECVTDMQMLTCGAMRDMLRAIDLRVLVLLSGALVSAGLAQGVFMFSMDRIAPSGVSFGWLGTVTAMTTSPVANLFIMLSLYRQDGHDRRMQAPFAASGIAAMCATLGALLPVYGAVDTLVRFMLLSIVSGAAASSWLLVPLMPRFLGVAEGHPNAAGLSFTIVTFFNMLLSLASDALAPLLAHAIRSGHALDSYFVMLPFIQALTTAAATCIVGSAAASDPRARAGDVRSTADQWPHAETL